VVIVVNAQPTAGGATPIATVTRAVNIPAGHATLVVFPITSIPVGLDGAYSAVAQVTDPYGGGSSVTVGAAYMIDPPVVTLSAVIDSFTPASLTAGAAVRGTLSFTISNTGNVPAGGLTAASAFQIALGLTSPDGTQTASLGTVSRLLIVNPNQSRKVTLAFNTPLSTSLLAGTYSPTVVMTIVGTSYTAAATGTQSIQVS
jgi:hypothetical protein